MKLAKCQRPTLIGMLMSLSRAIYLSLLGLLVGACTNPGPPQGPGQAPSLPAELSVDFSGHWEKDFRRSDDFSNKVNLYYFDIRRSLATPVAGEGFSAAGLPSNDAILGLARFTEELTRGTRLEIHQDTQSIAIAREGDFTLRCAGFANGPVRSSNAFGQELCGWQNDQLVFRHDLQDLRIVYQLTLGPGGEQLNLTTTVSSAAVTAPLTISTYFNRYEPGIEEYDCEQTLSRQRVCRRAGSEGRAR